jgi:DNA repair photolyase
MLPGSRLPVKRMRLKSKTPLSGHGAHSNPDSRFSKHTRSPEHAQPDPGALDGRAVRKTELLRETAKSIISHNDSPDIPFDRSVNFVRGCEHGCIYCYARPTHAYLGLSPGLDFETRIIVKENAAELLRKELARPSYTPAPLALGANTDPYQPLEQKLRLTRRILQVLAEFNHPVTITTKGSLVERDIDILTPMAEKNLVRVMLSIATLDPEIARRLEPRAAAPHRRIAAIRRLSEAGIPTGVIVAPIIPALTDQDIERVLQAAREAGATMASYVFLRLPLEVRDLFVEWLEAQYPERARHVMSLVRQSRGGQDNDARFGQRMEGTGVFANLVAQRFRMAARRLGFRESDEPLNCELFCQPGIGPKQMDLFL